MAPLIPLTADGVNTSPTTGTLFDIDVDLSGNQYLLRLTSSPDSTFEIDIYASGTRGVDPARLRSIRGASTNLSLFTNSSAGGICLDASQNFIYVANGHTILRFPIDADGDAAGTIIVNTSGVIFTGIYYDNARSLLWVSCGAGDGPGIRAYDLSGTLVRNISCSFYWAPSNSVDSIAINGAGLIYGLIGSILDDNGHFASIVYVFDAAANGDSIPVRRVQAETGGAGSSAGLDIDTATGNLFISYASPPSHIISVADADSIVPSANFLTDISGTTTLLDYDFGLGIFDEVQNITVLSHYP